MRHDGPCRESYDPRSKGRCYKCGRPIDEAAPPSPPERMVAAQAFSEQEFSHWLGQLDHQIQEAYKLLGPAMDRNETWAFEAHQKIVTVLTALYS